MKQTLTQKLIARAAGRDSVRPGEVVTVRVDLAMGNDITLPFALKRLEEAGIDHVFDAARICITSGRHAPFRDVEAATMGRHIQQFCERHGIEHFYGHAQGMDHALAPELGLIRPGMLICNADSHTCTYGALGAFGVPMGSTDIAYVLAFGETWLRVPETIRVEYVGRRGTFVTSKDMVLATTRLLGMDGARYKALEFGGEGITDLSVDERFTITNMAIEMGAKTGLMAPDDKVMAYLAGRTTELIAPLFADDGAHCERSVHIDLDTLEPMVARPYSPANVAAVSELAGIRVTQVNIGTCTNGRLVDLQQAASLLRGHRVPKSMRLIVTPATQNVYKEALKTGTLEVLAEAGATINPPGCGPCGGWHLGSVTADDVCLTTHNRNFRGRMGHVDGQIYLASPFVAAATALTGAITDPRSL